MTRVLVLLTYLWLCILVHATQPNTGALTEAEQATPCFAKCVAESLAGANCTIEDHECRCENQQVNTLTSACIAKNCSLADAIVAAQTWAEQCDEPHNNHSAGLRAAAIGSGVAGIVIVICRVIARLCTSGRLWWDDWSHIVAGLFTIAITVTSNLCISAGMGYHLYDIPSATKVRNLIIYYYLCQIFWLMLIYFIKISILFLYIRIFPEIHHFRYYVIATMVFATTIVLILTPMVIWQCVPISAIWNFNRGDARCLNISELAYANAALNILTEVIILILPLPLLRTLRVSRPQKLALYILFGCGILVIAVAAARIPSLSQVEDYRDPTYLSTDVIYWTAAETSVAHLCAAALAVRPFYVKMRSMWRRRRRSRSSSTAPIAKSSSACNPHADMHRAAGSSGEASFSQGADLIEISSACPGPEKEAGEL